MHNCTSASSPHRLTIRIIALKENYKGVSLRKTYQDTTKWFKSGPLTQNALWNRIEVRWNPDFRASKRSGNWFENSGVQKRVKGGIGSHLFYDRINLIRTKKAAQNNVNSSTLICQPIHHFYLDMVRKIG